MEGYLTVTELPGYKASKEQIERLYHRYHFASLFCEGKDVLEVACGGGIGLGYLANRAKKIVGGDIDEEILEIARRTYQDRTNVEIQKLDAQNLPFEDHSFDVVIFYEAIYYLPQPERFVDEAYRVLKDNGVLLVCTVNKDWPDFNPSPYSTRYFSLPELNTLLNKKFSSIELYGVFLATTDSLKVKVISIIKRIAVALRVIPKTMKSKELLKRIFFGKLLPLPPEIKDGMAEYTLPVPLIHNTPNRDFKVLYAVARVSKKGVENLGR